MELPPFWNGLFRTIRFVVLGSIKLVVWIVKWTGCVMLLGHVKVEKVRRLCGCLESTHVCGRCGGVIGYRRTRYGSCYSCSRMIY